MDTIDLFKLRLMLSVSTLGQIRVSFRLPKLMNLVAESAQEAELEALVQAIKYISPALFWTDYIVFAQAFHGHISPALFWTDYIVFTQAFHGHISVVPLSLLSRVNMVGLVFMNHKYSVLWL